MAAVNYLAVLASAVASMIIGSVWYGPLFGKKFIHETGMDMWSPEKQAAMKKKMGVSYFAQFVASCVMLYVLAGLIVGFGQNTLSGGLLTGFVMWLGFVVPLKLGDAIWGGKMSLFWMNIGNMLLTLLVAGAIIGGWK